MHKNDFRQLRDAVESAKQRRLIKWPTVKDKVGKSRTQVWRDVRAGLFPPPVQTGPNSVAWFEDEIDDHLAKLPRVDWAPAKRDGGEHAKG